MGAVGLSGWAQSSGNEFFITRHIFWRTKCIYWTVRTSCEEHFIVDTSHSFYTILSRIFSLTIMYTRALPILLLLAGVRSQYISCPLLGADFPPPTNLASDSFIAAAAQNLTAQLSALTNSSTSFSVQFFSAADPSPLFDYHHTAPSVAQSSAGTQVITADSIYRVGSISKLYTVFLFLSEVGDGYFHRPVTEFVWELADADMMRVEGDGRTRWGDITLGALASQMAGIARDGMFV